MGNSKTYHTQCFLFKQYAPLRFDYFNSDVFSVVILMYYSIIIAYINFLFKVEFSLVHILIILMCFYILYCTSLYSFRKHIYNSI